MKLNRNRINKINTITDCIPENTIITIRLQNVTQQSELIKMGFSQYAEGDQESTLRATNTYTRRNTEVWQSIDKNAPLEQHTYSYNVAYYRRRDGAYISYTATRTIMRYKRVNHQPYSVIFTYNNENKQLEAEDIFLSPNNYEVVKNTVNIFLKSFGQVEVTYEGEETINIDEEVPFENFPSGEYPFDRINDVINKERPDISEEERNKLHSTYKLIQSFGKPHITKGAKNYSDYFCFSFDDKGFTIVESLYYGNATYIFGNDYKQCIQLTKAEVIKGKKALFRILHGEKWDKRIIKAVKSI